MAAPFLGKGWKHPIRPNARGGLDWSEADASIDEAIWIILSTPRRSRIMLPEFGCAIHDYVFASLNTTTINLVQNSVQEALTLWEPRIELIKVDVSQEKAHEGKLEVSIDYRVRTTNNRFNLVYPFYVKEG